MDHRSTESDAEIVRRVCAGQTDCFAELVRRYQPALARVARSRLQRADWAEDVVQETFLAAFKSCASYDPRYSFRTWVWTILLNQCRGHYRRHKRSGPVESLSADCDETLDPSVADDHGTSPLGQLLAKERAARLESLLDQLPDVQADALRLRFFGALKFHEIATTMQCSLNTAKARVRVGLERMAKMIETAESQGQLSGVTRKES